MYLCNIIFFNVYKHEGVLNCIFIIVMDAKIKFKKKIQLVKLLLLLPYGNYIQTTTHCGYKKYPEMGGNYLVLQIKQT